MSIPAKVQGGGNNSAAQNVFKVDFSQALSAPPTLKMWDNSSTFPAVDAAGSTTAKEAFTGTSGNSNKPMYGLYATTSAAPGAANWFPSSATAGSANPNRMKGSTNYVTDPTTPGAGGSIKFNLSAEFPSDATVPSSSSQNILLEVGYQYTGSAPSLSYYFNDSSAGGTEGSPSWTAFTPGTHGIRLVNSGTSAGTYKFTLPTSGVSTVGELWVTA
jgi:hypothetical protein